MKVKKSKYENGKYINLSKKCLKILKNEKKMISVKGKYRNGKYKINIQKFLLNYIILIQSENGLKFRSFNI